MPKGLLASHLDFDLFQTEACTACMWGIPVVISELPRFVSSESCMTVVAVARTVVLPTAVLAAVTGWMA